MKASKWALGLVLGGIAGAACAQTALPLSEEDGDPTGGSTGTSTTTGGGGSSSATTTTGATGQGGTGATTSTTATGQGGTGTTSTTSTSSTTTSSGQGGTGSTTSCHPPTTLHPPKPGKPSIFCPFSGVDGGKNEYCTAQSEHCCEPKAGTATCQPAATPCEVDDTDWQCEDPVADCAFGETCCGKGTFVQNPDPACANYAKAFTGTYCAKACQPGEIVMCTDDSECGGKTCTPMYTKGNQVGACQ
jgi:hypothetical protein